MITSLLMLWERRWRCRSCGNNHRYMSPTCPYDNLPRDFL